MHLTYSLWYTGTDRILNADNTEKSKVVQQRAELDATAFGVLSVRGWSFLEILVHEANSAEGSTGVLGDRVDNGLSVSVGHGLRVESVELGVERSETKKDLRCTLDDEAVASALELDDRTHALLARVEREHVSDSLVVTSLGQREKTQVLFVEPAVSVLEPTKMGLPSSSPSKAVILIAIDCIRSSLAAGDTSEAQEGISWAFSSDCIRGFSIVSVWVWQGCASTGRRTW